MKVGYWIWQRVNRSVKGEMKEAKGYRLEEAGRVRFLSRSAMP